MISFTSDINFYRININVVIDLSDRYFSISKYEYRVGYRSIPNNFAGRLSVENLRYNVISIKNKYLNLVLS